MNTSGNWKRLAVVALTLLLAAERPIPRSRISKRCWRAKSDLDLS
jgi:hypothetical protein